MQTLETNRLILRPWRESDLTDFHEYCTDPEVGPNAGWKPHESMEGSRQILSIFLKDESESAVVLKETGKVIGSFGLYCDRLGHKALGSGREIGYVLSHDYWGHGLIPEAVRRVIRFAFDEVGLDYLSISHFPFNGRSKRVIEKCRFRYEKTAQATYRNYRGEMLAEVCYLLTRQDYLENREFYQS